MPAATNFHCRRDGRSPFPSLAPPPFAPRSGIRSDARTHFPFPAKRFRPGAERQVMRRGEESSEDPLSGAIEATPEVSRLPHIPDKFSKGGIYGPPPSGSFLRPATVSHFRIKSAVRVYDFVARTPRAFHTRAFRLSAGPAVRYIVNALHYGGYLPRAVDNPRSTFRSGGSSTSRGARRER